MAEGLSATAGALAAWSQAFLGDALGLSTVSVSAHNGTSPGIAQYIDTSLRDPPLDCWSLITSGVLVGSV